MPKSLRVPRLETDTDGKDTLLALQTGLALILLNFFLITNYCEDIAKYFFF